MVMALIQTAAMNVKVNEKNTIENALDLRTFKHKSHLLKKVVVCYCIRKQYVLMLI